MSFAKLSQKLATDQNRYNAMSEKKRRSFYGRFIARRIRKTVDKLRNIEKMVDRRTISTGDYNPN